MNKSPLKFLLSLVSACVTLLINGDEDINPNVSAWVFPLMLVCGGLVMLADSKIRPEKYAVAASSKSELVLSSYLLISRYLFFVHLFACFFLAISRFTAPLWPGSALVVSVRSRRLTIA